jgi:hypothetical protein
MLAKEIKMKRCLKRWLTLARNRTARLTALSSELTARIKTLLCLLCIRCWKSYASESDRRKERQGDWPLLCRIFHSWRSLSITHQTAYPSLLTSPQPLVPSPEASDQRTGILRSFFSKLGRKVEEDDPFAELSATLKRGLARGSKPTSL